MSGGSYWDELERARLAEDGYEAIELTEKELYFDYASNAPFDDDTKSIIDRIAYDPRFNGFGVSDDAVAAFASHLTTDRRQAVASAAEDVYRVRLRPDVRRRAEHEVARALRDPRFELLPPWSDEPDDLSYFADLTPPLSRQVFKEIEWHLSEDPRFVAARTAAIAEMEAEAEALAHSLPQQAQDALRLSNRVAERDAIVQETAGQMSVRRLHWLAYHVQRHVKETGEEAFLDRYSIAAKKLQLIGHSRAHIRKTLRVTERRLDQLLARTASGHLDATDPLARSIPELLSLPAAPVVLPDGPSVHATPPVERMYAEELVALVAHTEDNDVLQRVLKRKLTTVVEALFERHIRRGDLGDDVLRTLPHRFPQRHEEMLRAHRSRPLPPQTAIALASYLTEAVLDFDDESAGAFTPADAEQGVALALRTGDVAVLSDVLARGEHDRLFMFCLDLLVSRPVRPTLAASDEFTKALVGASARVSSTAVEAVLRLVACQNAAELQRNIDLARDTGDFGIDPYALAVAAVGSYDMRAVGHCDFLPGLAQQLWACAELTREHALARSAVAHDGQERATIRTRHTTFVATAGAIRKYPNSGEATYTYINIRFAVARKWYTDGNKVWDTMEPPSLPYEREMGKHPDAPNGEDVEVIVWPLPLQPAVYSLGVTVGGKTKHFAVADGLVSVIDNHP